VMWRRSWVQSVNREIAEGGIFRFPFSVYEAGDGVKLKKATPSLRHQFGGKKIILEMVTTL